MQRTENPQKVVQFHPEPQNLNLMIMITEDYVSFETAKLLKEKGFDGECFFAFYKDGRIVGRYDSERSYNYYDRPTLQMAMKWLREVHNLAIELTWEHVWLADITKMTSKFEPIEYEDGDRSYEVACEDAIRFCLENLI